MNEQAATGCILVLTTVHPADDPRIRERTVAVLARQHSVRYATRLPGPTRQDDHEWVPLPGGRPRRFVAALAAAMRRDVAMLSIHDPELVPIGLATRLLRRIPVVFDVHEHVPDQIRHKQWVMRPLRPPLAAVARGLLRLAERHLTLTLAEAGYRQLFRVDHPVLPNYPDVATLPDPVPDSRRIVYVGDVQEARGAMVAVEAVAAMRAPLPLHLYGRCHTDLARRLTQLATDLGVELHLHGFVPHSEAMDAARSATVGLCPLLDLPNYRWSLPTKVIEYLALGVPVVASDLPGTREVIGGLPGTVLVSPGDAASLAGALERLASDPSVRQAAAAGATDIRERFRWPAERLLEVYASQPSR